MMGSVFLPLVPEYTRKDRVPAAVVDGTLVAPQVLRSHWFAFAAAMTLHRCCSCRVRRVLACWQTMNRR